MSSPQQRALQGNAQQRTAQQDFAMGSTQVAQQSQPPVQRQLATDYNPFMGTQNAVPPPSPQTGGAIGPRYVAEPASSPAGQSLGQVIGSDLGIFGRDVQKAGGQIVGGVESGVAGYESITQPIRNITQGPGYQGTPEKVQTVGFFKQGGLDEGLGPVERQIAVTPGQGPSQQQTFRESVFLAAGIVPGGDLIVVGEKAGAGILADIGSKIGVGFAFGSSTSALKGGSPEQIVESGALSAGFFAGGGAVASRVGSSLDTAAAQGRLASVTEGNPTLYQRFAMFITKEGPPAPPVGGAGSVKALGIGPEGEPLGIPPGASPVGKGFETTASEPTQPPISLHNFLQDFEGNFPTKGKGFFEGEPSPAPPGRSTPTPATRPPYSGTPGTPFKVDFMEPAPSASQLPGTGRALFGGEYGIKPTEQTPPAGRGGPAGAGFSGAGNIATPTVDFEQQYGRLPLGADFDAAGRFRSTFNEPSISEGAGVFDIQGIRPTIPGFASSSPSSSSSAFKTILPPIGDYSTTPGISSLVKPAFGQVQSPSTSSIQSQLQPPGFGLGQSQGVGIGQGQGQAQGVGQSQPITTPSLTTTTPGTSPEFGVPNIPKGIGSEGAFSFGFASPFPDKRDKSLKDSKFGFRQLLHPGIENYLDIGGRSGKRSRRKKR